MQKNALYYPHIGLHNAAWIKAMALYYDSIYRIVPDGVTPDDSEELQPLLEEGSIGRMIDPVPYSKHASDEFLRGLDTWSAAALEPSDEDKSYVARLHTDKIDDRVRELFREAGFREESDWLYVPSELASSFMLYMAQHISRANKLSLITSDWGAWTGSTYFGLEGQIDEFMSCEVCSENEDALEFGLFGLMLSELVPLNIAEIPAEKILEFRIKRSDELAEFRTCIESLRDEISDIESPEVRIDVIRDKAQSIVRAQNQLKASADFLKAKGWFGVSLMGVPAPIALGHLLSIPTASTVALGASGLAIGALFSIRSTREELQKLSKENPASFVVELKRSFKRYTSVRGGGDMNFHAFNCMEEFVND